MLRSYTTVHRLLSPALLSAALVTAGAGLFATAAAAAPLPASPSPAATADAPGPNRLFNGWGISPTGQSVELSDMPLKMVISPDGKILAASSGGFRNTGVTLISIPDRKVLQFLPLPRAWNGIAFSKDGTHLFVSGGNSHTLYSYQVSETGATLETKADPDATDKGAVLGSIAVQPDTGKLYVCNEAEHQIWVVNPTTLQREASIEAGQYPHTAVFGQDARYLYVSDWGGRSVSVLDTQTGTQVRQLPVGLRPNDMALAPDGRLFVVCSGDNTVHVLQTRTLESVEPGASRTRRPPEGVREILSTSLYPASPEGSTPDAAAVSPDGHTLYVANADNNDVMVADISNPAATQVLGFIPTGWYPTALAVAPDGTILAASGKGLRSLPSYTTTASQAPVPGENQDQSSEKAGKYTYIAELFQGWVSFINPAAPDALSAFTAQVKQNSPYRPEELRQAVGASHSIIPDRPGEPCPIQHVLYIIKENRTYDQVFGDFKNSHGRPAGNGDAQLTMYGEKVTPNHHELARDYVLLDNLYCNGEVSVDGHSWCDAAIATDFNERKWIMSYSGHGALPGDRDMDDPENGYLWDLCRRSGVSFKCYGEGAGQVPEENRGTWSGGRDMNRVSGWIKDLHTAEKTGDLPQFMIMSLGEDHTSGTTPGRPTPDASVGSNDVALGKIVEAATRSKFWRSMAIFVIEDDAQNGPDHVDAHRTAGLVISPYVKRHSVDSTFYTTASMVRTIELILGLPPMTQYDASATPMFSCFANHPVVVAYHPLQPGVNLYALNTIKSPLASLSSTMDFSGYDRAPADELNHVLWVAARGPNVPYPAPVHGAIMDWGVPGPHGPLTAGAGDSHGAGGHAAGSHGAGRGPDVHPARDSDGD